MTQRHSVHGIHDHRHVSLDSRLAARAGNPLVRVWNGESSKRSFLAPPKMLVGQNFGRVMTRPTRPVPPGLTQGKTRNEATQLGCQSHKIVLYIHRSVMTKGLQEISLQMIMTQTPVQSSFLLMTAAVQVALKRKGLKRYICMSYIALVLLT